MAQTYLPIQTVTVGSGGSSSIEFTNIPQNYTDLKIVCSVRNTSSTGAIVNLAFNSDANVSNYDGRYIETNGTTIGSYTDQKRAIGYINTSTTTTSTFSNNEVYIPNYSGSAYKTFGVDGLMENNSTTHYIALFANIWKSTSAITSITLTPTSNSFAQHSTFCLYGIGGVRASGGTITADSNYTYHTFTSTGSFTAMENIKQLETLIIAGGGGGGKRGAGGGAGGLLLTSGQSVIAGSTYLVVIGAGGSGSTSTFSTGSNGSNSQFSSITQSVGGGGGGSVDNRTGANGGSGGGGFVGSAGGSGTAGQGNAGGTNTATGGQDTGSGGGGAGGVGASGDASFPGSGGPGTGAYWIWANATNTSSSGYYAGGGGGAGNSTGSSGGIGGGAQGRSNSTGDNGSANTGGGGGAGGNNTGGPFNGGPGGSGLIIIRYPN